MRILFNLMTCLADRYSAALKFHMDDRHPVYEQEHVSTTVAHDVRMRGEMWLARNLVAAFAARYFHAVVYLERDGLAKMQRILWFVADDVDFLTVDEAV